MVHPPVVHPSVTRQLALCQPVVRQPGRHVPRCCPFISTRLELVRSNPLTPGTLVCQARYPDQPEPIKLNYQKYNNAHWTRWRSCGGAVLG